MKNSKQRRKITYRQKLVADYLTRGIEDRERIAELLSIEHSIKVTGRTVGNDKAAIDDYWKDEAKQDVEVIKARLKAKYERLYGEAFAAWLKSLEDAETTIQEMIDTNEGGGNGNGQRLKASTRKEGQSGNPALLAQAQAALKAIREMFGVDPATKQQNINVDLSNLTDAQLQRIAAGEDPTQVLASSTESGG